MLFTCTLILQVVYWHFIGELVNTVLHTTQQPTNQIAQYISPDVPNPISCQNSTHMWLSANRENSFSKVCKHNAIMGWRNWLHTAEKAQTAHGVITITSCISCTNCRIENANACSRSRSQKTLTCIYTFEYRCKWELRMHTRSADVSRRFTMWVVYFCKEARVPGLMITDLNDSYT